MTKALQGYGINPKLDYLRASSPTQDDGILLRAAKYGSEAPQEGLLRASNTSEP